MGNLDPGNTLSYLVESNKRNAKHRFTVSIIVMADSIFFKLFNILFTYNINNVFTEPLIQNETVGFNCHN